MKVSLTVLFVLAMIVASTQTFRHVYVKFLDSRDSVLDDFQSEVESDLVAANSLDELVELYGAANEEVEKYEGDPSNPSVAYRERRSTTPYEQQIAIKKEIQNREHDQRQLTKLWFYWGCGLMSLFFGFLAFRYINPWLGFSTIVTGFSEMLVWTSPLFHNRLLSLQFEQLLDHKLMLSIVTWLILNGVWLMVQKYDLLTDKKTSKPTV